MALQGNHHGTIRLSRIVTMGGHKEKHIDDHGGIDLASLDTWRARPHVTYHLGCHHGPIVARLRQRFASTLLRDYGAK